MVYKNTVVNNVSYSLHSWSTWKQPHSFMYADAQNKEPNKAHVCRFADDSSSLIICQIEFQCTSSPDYHGSSFLFLINFLFFPLIYLRDLRGY